MKIGILTFHQADSYGAVLQAYALQQTLLRFGAESEFVQLNTPAPAAQAPAAMGAAAIFARKLQIEGQKRKDLFDAFRREHMRLSPIYEPTDPIDGDYDAFVAGSDQIWNFRIPGADARYFLPFAAPEKRYSYAASFGTDDLPEQTKEWAGRQLASFRGLSVREESGCRILKELTGRDAQVCLDPTLLLPPEDWEALAPLEEQPPYVLLFLLKYDETLLARAKEEAQRRGIPLRVITTAFMPQLGIAPWNTTGVTQWLGAIRNASCVFTNSFHGTVFSMVFSRPFHVQRLTGELATRNGRIDELLRFLGITEVLDGIVQPDRAVIWQILASRQEASLDYLRGIIHDTL